MRVIWLIQPVFAGIIFLTGLCLCAMLIGRVLARDSFTLERVSVSELLPRLGDLYVRYNVPCSLTLTANTINVQYPGFAAEIPIPYDIDAMRRTLLTPRAQVTALFFLEDQPCDAPMSFPSSRNIYVRWCGFTTLGQYIEQCRLPGLILLPS